MLNLTVMWYFSGRGLTGFVLTDQLLLYIEFVMNSTRMKTTKDISIFQMTTKKSIHHLIFQSTNNDHFWSINLGGYSRLKPPVKTTPGFDRPTMPLAEKVLKDNNIYRTGSSSEAWLPACAIATAGLRLGCPPVR